jgi:hypothetical protein
LIPIISFSTNPDAEHAIDEAFEDHEELCECGGDVLYFVKGVSQSCAGAGEWSSHGRVDLLGPVYGVKAEHVPSRCDFQEFDQEFYGTSFGTLFR